MYEPSRIARIIEAHREAEGVSVRSAAKKAGLSEGRWRQIAKGYQQATRDVRVPVNAPVETLVRMALALHMTTYDFARAVDDSEEGQAVAKFRTALAAALPKPEGSPMFGGSYEDPAYLGNIEEWVSELQTRIEMLEERLARVEPDAETDFDVEDSDPDYSQMSEQDAYDLAASKGEENIGHDELPHEP